MSISLSVRPLDQQRRLLAVRLYSKWYCAMSGVDVLARRFRLASNRYIICESANIEVCQCQVIISNGLFKLKVLKVLGWKYFITNYILNFLYIIFNEKSFKWKYYYFMRAINCTHKLTCVCAYMWACNRTHLTEQCRCL